MAENNATCSICGSGYHLCLSCRDSMQLAPYKVYCCSADCYKVFQVIRGFSTGVYAKEEFKSKLKNLDLSNLENYREHIKVLIKDALKEEKPVVKATKKAESIIEAKPIIAEVTEVINEKVENVSEVEKTEDTVKSTVSRKRNCKVDNEVEETE